MKNLPFLMLKTGQIERGINLVSKLIGEVSEPVERVKYTALLAEAYFEAKDYKNAVKFASDVFQSDVVDENAWRKLFMSLRIRIVNLVSLKKRLMFCQEPGKNFQIQSSSKMFFIRLGLFITIMASMITQLKF
jgi:hypothetical protein